MSNEDKNVFAQRAQSWETQARDAAKHSRTTSDPNLAELYRNLAQHYLSLSHTSRKLAEFFRTESGTANSENSQVHTERTYVNQVDVHRRWARSSARTSDEPNVAEEYLTCLTVRERQILDKIIAGQRNKTIAHILGVSQRTVEHHRASIMKKTGSTSLAALLRLVIAADKREDSLIDRQVAEFNRTASMATSVQ